LAQTKSGKKLMNLVKDDEAIISQIILEDDDSIAILNSARKLLIFPLNEVPELKRGQGVQLQKLQNAQLTALKLFALKDGISWHYLGQLRNEKKLTAWIGKRGKIGKTPPTGLAKNNRFES
jgi:topoisomerase IV subunit A